MRRLLTAVTLAALFGQAMSGQALAQAPFDPKRSAGQAEHYVQLLNACDAGAIGDMIDPEVSSIGAGGQFAQSKQTYIAVVRAICQSGAKVNLQPTLLRTDEFGDIAISVFELRGSATVNGQTGQANQRVTMVLRRGKADGVWRILHIQTANAQG